MATKKKTTKKDMDWARSLMEQTKYMVAFSEVLALENDLKRGIKFLEHHLKLTEQAKKCYADSGYYVLENGNIEWDITKVKGLPKNTESRSQEQA
jgi:hypothetical protein